jgi:hypothetical protein
VRREIATKENCVPVKPYNGALEMALLHCYAQSRYDSLNGFGKEVIRIGKGRRCTA